MWTGAVEPQPDSAHAADRSFHILMEDWRQKAGEIQMRVDRQSKLQSYAVTLFAAITAFAASLEISADGSAQQWFAPQVFLFAPLGFIVLGFAFSDQDFMIAALAGYLESAVLVDLRSFAPSCHLCHWEHYLGAARQKRRRTLVGRLACQSKYLVFVAPAVMCLAVFINLQFGLTLAPWAVAGMLLLVTVAIVAFHIASLSGGERALVEIPRTATAQILRTPLPNHK